MKRETIQLSSDYLSITKLVRWAQKHDVFTLYNSNSLSNNPLDIYSKFDLLLTIGVRKLYESKNDAFDNIQSAGQNNDWHIVQLAYDLKNTIEKLSSSNTDKLKFPESTIYIPELVFEVKKDSVSVHFFSDKYNAASISALLEEIKATEESNEHHSIILPIESTVTKEEYIERVTNIKKHIQLGDIYEMNYCQEFFSQDAKINPGNIYLKLNELSPMPFSVFSKFNSHYIISASPERYLAKRENKIISQPIKGTARRGDDYESDSKTKHQLLLDPKERSENVMIVDLVRNDLSRTATKNSVNVEELFAIKTYKQLHQMVSTVTSMIDSNTNFSEVIKTTFPMGSMTGAPKIRAMELIEESEKTKRGMYSGSVGYISPDGDADFNVIIRSILFNENNKYLSFMVGSAITIGSDPEKEYEECLLKASAMMKVLRK